MFYTVYKSAVGELLVGDYQGKICLCDWNLDSRLPVRSRVAIRAGEDWQLGNTPAIQTCVSQLDEYFSGDRRRFGLPIITFGTDFQHRVWEALCRIPYGETRSYGDLAAQLGLPTASRAVAAAARSNPISIIVPCHRLIGADGSMTGYAGSVRVKKALLRHEQIPASDIKFAWLEEIL